MLHEQLANIAGLASDHKVSPSFQPRLSQSDQLESLQICRLKPCGKQLDILYHCLFSVHVEYCESPGDIPDRQPCTAGVAIAIHEQLLQMSSGLIVSPLAAAPYHW
jgi:hypothetical protein